MRLRRDEVLAMKEVKKFTVAWKSFDMVGLAQTVLIGVDRAGLRVPTMNFQTF